MNDYEDDESILWLMALAAGSAWAQGQAQPVGIFEGHGDVGKVLHDGSSEYDAARHACQLAGSGDNVWATADAFQYVWKKVSGDVSLTADITILGTGGNPHKKGMLMIRQSLDADSPYADAALHAVERRSAPQPSGLQEVKTKDVHLVSDHMAAARYPSSASPRPSHLAFRKS